MRSFITASLLIASALSQSTQDYLNCATSAISRATKSSFTDCTSKTAQECFCANKSAIKALTTSTAPSCSKLDANTLISYLCPIPDPEVSAPARHASRPMELAEKRAEPQVPRVVYVTETRTDCSCKSTAAGTPAHISQIPVDVPSSTRAMVTASSTPARHGLMGGAASSVVFGAQVPGATPSTRLGADPLAFTGVAGKGVEVRGVVVFGVAAVMAVMVAL
ncbi:unnamed protein product [Penicillium glandicola]